MTYYGRWTYKYEEAARRGAAGVLIVHETDPASYGWNTVKNSQHQHAVRHRPPEPGRCAHRRSKAGSSATLAEQIFAASGLNFDQAKAAGARRKDFQPIPLKATLSATAQANVETITSHNVVGYPAGQEVPGRDGDLQRALGSPRHRPAGRRAATRSIMARSTTRRASPSSSSRRAPSLASRGPTARSFSSP